MKNALTATIAFAAAAYSLAGCGPLEGNIKVPVASQCAASGLKGCPELTEGVVAYVEGEKEGGDKHLRLAAAENTPQQLHRFAVALRPLVASSPDHTGEAIRAAVESLTRPAARAAEHHSAERHAAVAKTEAPPITHASLATHTKPAPPREEELRAGTEMPATSKQATACGGIFGSDPKCVLTKVLVGPLVVTNAYTSGGCPDELFLAAGHLEKPHWVLLRVSRAPMNVTGQFILGDGEELYAGVRASEKTPKDDPKCAITWSGFRPATGASSEATTVAGRDQED